MPDCGRSREHGASQHATYFLAVACVLALLCCAGVTTAANVPDVVRFCPGARMVDRLPRHAAVDSTWRRIGQAFGLRRIVNRKNAWAAECAWIRPVNAPVRTYTLGELMSLDDRGQIPVDMLFVAVNYKWVVRGETVDDAKQHAIDDVRRGVPRAVDKALKEQVANNAKKPVQP